MPDTPYRHLLDHFSDAFFVTDTQGRILDVNTQAYREMGYSLAELMALTVADFALDYTQEELLALWQKMEPGEHTVATNTHQRKDGSCFPVEVHITCQLVDGEKRFFTISHDITERVRRDQEIQLLNAALEQQVEKSTQQWRHSTHLLDAVMRGTSDIVFVKDRQGRYVFANPAAEAITQMPPGGLIGKTDAEILGGHNNFADDDAAVYRSSTPVVSESHALIEGRRLSFQSIKSQYRNEHGEVIGLLGISRDTTQMRESENQLRQSYDSLRRAERLSRIGSWTLDLASGEIEASEMMYEMNGLDPQGPKLTQDNIAHMMPPQDYAKVAAAIAQCAQTGQPYRLDVTHYTPDGGQFPASILGQADYDSSGRIVSLSGTLQDLSEREQARQRLEALADNLPSGAIYRVEGTATTLRMSYISAGIEKLIGVSAQAIMADNAAYIKTIHPADLAMYRQQQREALERLSLFDCSFRIIRPDGSLRWLRCRSAPSRQEAGTIWDGIMLDITREREAELALQKAKEMAEAAERAKSEFLATMSHEIRTPMNTVIGMTRLIQQTPLLPKQRNYLEKVELSANALLSVINDILDFSKIEAGMLTLENVEFALDDVLETVSAVTTLRAEEKGIEVVYSVAPDVPRQLSGDPLRLSQVLNNLVSNAIKFTHLGEVVISIQTTETAGNRPVVPGKIGLEITVKDTGIGMSPAQMSQLFRPFSQADSQTTRRYGGSGLGLAICQRLVGQMGGELKVESSPGLGSTFYFSVQLHPAQLQQAPKPARYHGTPVDRVLIVDDNASARDILAEMVRGFGMRADTVDSGEQALSDLQLASRVGTPYGLVLMDWRMPGMDGLEVARRIREEEHLSATPAVLMVTAYGRDEVMRKAEELHLQGLLIKPVTQSVLFNAILEALQSQGGGLSRRALPDTPGQPQALHTNPIQLYPHLHGKNVLVVDDNALNREVAADFLSLVGVQVSLATNGAEALSMLEHHHYDAVLMDVHMPQMDGLDATRALRQLPHLQQLPVIALTAQARVEDRSAIEEAGMNAHLTKPIDERKLYETLSEWIAGPGNDADTPDAPESEFLRDEARVAATPGINHAKMLQRFHGNAERVERVLAGFYRDFADAPQTLVLHVQQSSWEPLSMLAHSLKGALGYLDATALVQAAETIESQAREWTQAPPPAAQPQRLLHAETSEFAAQLQTLLQGLATRQHPPAPPSAALDAAPAASPPAATSLRQDLKHLKRLVADGDYAAVSELERMLLASPTARWTPLLQQILQHVEDLDGEAALAAIERLEQILP
ncbi:response regulator [Comamonas sp. B-9]|uniref:response regulator n=1 Tax=Comamonas sp. B-9 TaxID=1055192 RepID=UPI0003956452|nr:response regulator [Comamonas sp. B-9]